MYQPFFFGDAFEKFSQRDGNSWGDLLGDSCGLSDCAPEVSSGVPVVTDVLVFSLFFRCGCDERSFGVSL